MLTTVHPKLVVVNGKLRRGEPRGEVLCRDQDFDMIVSSFTSRSAMPPCLRVQKSSGTISIIVNDNFHNEENDADDADDTVDYSFAIYADQDDGAAPFFKLFHRLHLVDHENDDEDESENENAKLECWVALDNATRQSWQNVSVCVHNECYALGPHVNVEAGTITLTRLYSISLRRVELLLLSRAGSLARAMRLFVDDEQMQVQMPLACIGDDVWVFDARGNVFGRARVSRASDGVVSIELGDAGCGGEKAVVERTEQVSAPSCLTIGDGRLTMRRWRIVRTVYRFGAPLASACLAEHVAADPAAIVDTDATTASRDDVSSSLWSVERGAECATIVEYVAFTEAIDAGALLSLRAVERWQQQGIADKSVAVMLTQVVDMNRRIGTMQADIAEHAETTSTLSDRMAMLAKCGAAAKVAAPLRAFAVELGALEKASLTLRSAVQQLAEERQWLLASALPPDESPSPTSLPSPAPVVDADYRPLAQLADPRTRLPAALSPSVMVTHHHYHHDGKTMPLPPSVISGLSSLGARMRLAKRPSKAKAKQRATPKKKKLTFSTAEQGDKGEEQEEDGNEESDNDNSDDDGDDNDDASAKVASSSQEQGNALLGPPSATVAFAPTKMDPTNSICNIAAMPEYNRYSPEELRYMDKLALSSNLSPYLLVAPNAIDAPLGFFFGNWTRTPGHEFDKEEDEDAKEEKEEEEEEKKKAEKNDDDDDDEKEKDEKENKEKEEQEEKATETKKSDEDSPKKKKKPKKTKKKTKKKATSSTTFGTTFDFGPPPSSTSPPSAGFSFGTSSSSAAPYSGGSFGSQGPSLPSFGSGATLPHYSGRGISTMPPAGLGGGFGASTPSSFGSSFGSSNNAPGSSLGSGFGASSSGKFGGGNKSYAFGGGGGGGGRGFGSMPSSSTATGAFGSSGFGSGRGFGAPSFGSSASLGLGGAAPKFSGAGRAGAFGTQSFNSSYVPLSSSSSGSGGTFNFGQGRGRGQGRGQPMSASSSGNAFSFGTSSSAANGTTSGAFGSPNQFKSKKEEEEEEEEEEDVDGLAPEDEKPPESKQKHKEDEKK
jgi:hypothetical protein